MPYNENLAQRVRRVFPKESDLSERKMFGGIAFMLGDHMCCGVLGDDLIVRVGPDSYDEAMTQPNTRAMDLTGKPMRGLIFVDERGTRADPALRRWVQRGVDYVKSLQ
jgi:TfoX/Sxy family transcriptional regulator of competence genes